MTEETSRNSFREGEITWILHVIQVAGGALRHPYKEVEHYRCHHKRSQVPRTPHKMRKITQYSRL